MKGYLNNLSQRTLNMGNRVEPRLPSLFEPQPERVAAGYQEEITTETHQIASPPVRREQTRREQTVEHRNRESTRYVPMASSSEEMEIEDAVMPELALPLELSPPLDPISDPVSPLVQPEAVHDPKSVEASDSSSEFAPPVTRMQPDSRMKTDQSLNPSSSVSSAAPVPLELEVHEENSDVSHLPTEKFETFESFSIARGNPASPTWSYTREQRRKRQSVGLLIDPPEPSINVTIGRVEVRAVPSDNKQTARRQTESPVMPLEEYLRKQRRGGDR